MNIQALRARWDLLAPRERGALLLAASVLLLALVWWVLLGPALRTLREAETQHRQLDTQLQSIRRLQAEALALQSQPRLTQEEAVRALEAALRQRLAGTAQLSVAGERATVTLKGVDADALARWLAQVRANARVLPAEARLTRSPAGSATAAAPAPATWDGTLVLALPAR